MLRPWIAGMALLATAGALSGCDPDTPPSRQSAAPPSRQSAAPPSASPCADPAIDFGPVRKRDVLIEVGEVVTIASPEGGRLDSTFEPLSPYTAQVVAAGDLPKDVVYEAFLHKIKPEAESPRLGEVATRSPGSVSVEGPGRFVEYEGVTAREATFRYRCGTVTVSGTVSSWIVTVSGVLECDEKPAPANEMASKAAELRCTG